MVHTFLRSHRVTAVCQVRFVQLPWVTVQDGSRPKALDPAHRWDLWRTKWAAWLTFLRSQYQWMANGSWAIQGHGHSSKATPGSAPHHRQQATETAGKGDV